MMPAFPKLIPEYNRACIEGNLLAIVKVKELNIGLTGGTERKLATIYNPRLNSGSFTGDQNSPHLTVHFRVITRQRGRKEANDIYFLLGTYTIILNSTFHTPMRLLIFDSRVGLQFVLKPNSFASRLLRY